MFWYDSSRGSEDSDGILKIPMVFRRFWWDILKTPILGVRRFCWFLEILIRIRRFQSFWFRRSGKIMTNWLRMYTNSIFIRTLSTQVVLLKFLNFDISTFADAQKRIFEVDHCDYFSAGPSTNVKTSNIFQKYIFQLEMSSLVSDIRVSCSLKYKIDVIGR